MRTAAGYDPVSVRLGVGSRKGERLIIHLNVELRSIISVYLGQLTYLLARSEKELTSNIAVATSQVVPLVIRHHRRHRRKR